VQLGKAYLWINWRFYLFPPLHFPIRFCVPIAYSCPGSQPNLTNKDIFQLQFSMTFHHNAIRSPSFGKSANCKGTKPLGKPWWVNLSLSKYQNSNLLTGRSRPSQMVNTRFLVEGPYYPKEWKKAISLHEVFPAHTPIVLNSISFSCIYCFVILIWFLW